MVKGVLFFSFIHKENYLSLSVCFRLVSRLECSKMRVTDTLLYLKPR